MIGKLKLWAVAFGAAAVFVFGAFLSGRRAGLKDARVNRLEDTEDAHTRINEADTGVGATDLERIKRLQQLSEQLRN